MGEITSRLGIMFGFGNVPFINSEAIYYIKSYLGIFIIGIIGATPVIKILVEKIKNTKLSKVVNEDIDLFKTLDDYQNFVNFIDAGIDIEQLINDSLGNLDFDFEDKIPEI